MKCKKIIMLNSIDDTLTLPIYKIIKHSNYYKLERTCDKNDFIDNLCYIVPNGTMVYDYLYSDKIIVMQQVLENLYRLKTSEINNTKNKNKSK